MKPGDKVKRIAESWGIAKYGGIYTVRHIADAPNKSLHLIEDTDRIYDASAFIVVEPFESTFIPEFIN